MLVRPLNILDFALIGGVAFIVLACVVFLIWSFRPYHEHIRLNNKS